MKHKIFSTQIQSTLNFTTKRFNGFLQEQWSRTGKIHQIVGMNHQRFEVVLLPKPAHLGALWTAKFIGRPLPRTGGEHLKRVAAQPVCPLRRILHAAGAGSMNADAAGGEAGGAFRVREPYADLV